MESFCICIVRASCIIITSVVNGNASVKWIPENAPRGKVLKVFTNCWWFGSFTSATDFIFSSWDARSLWAVIAVETRKFATQLGSSWESLRRISFTHSNCREKLSPEFLREIMKSCCTSREDFIESTNKSFSFASFFASNYLNELGWKLKEEIQVFATKVIKLGSFQAWCSTTSPRECRAGWNKQRSAPHSASSFTASISSIHWLMASQMPRLRRIQQCLDSGGLKRGSSEWWLKAMIYWMVQQQTRSAGDKKLMNNGNETSGVLRRSMKSLSVCGGSNVKYGEIMNRILFIFARGICGWKSTKMNNFVI